MLCVFFRVGTKIFYIYNCHIRFLLKARKFSHILCILSYVSFKQIRMDFRRTTTCVPVTPMPLLFCLTTAILISFYHSSLHIETCFNLKNKSGVWLDNIFIMADSFRNISVQKYVMYDPVIQVEYSLVMGTVSVYRATGPSILKDYQLKLVYVSIQTNYVVKIKS